MNKVCMVITVGDIPEIELLLLHELLHDAFNMPGAADNAVCDTD